MSARPYLLDMWGGPEDLGGQHIGRFGSAEAAERRMRDIFARSVKARTYGYWRGVVRGPGGFSLGLQRDPKDGTTIIPWRLPVVTAVNERKPS